MLTWLSGRLTLLWVVLLLVERKSDDTSESTVSSWPGGSNRRADETMAVAATEVYEMDASKS
jgi:hypothetical protein